MKHVTSDNLEWPLKPGHFCYCKINLMSNLLHTAYNDIISIRLNHQKWCPVTSIRSFEWSSLNVNSQTTTFVLTHQCFNDNDVYGPCRWSWLMRERETDKEWVIDRWAHLLRHVITCVWRHTATAPGSSTAVILMMITLTISDQCRHQLLVLTQYTCTVQHPVQLWSWHSQCDTVYLSLSVQQHSSYGNERLSVTVL